MGQDFDGGVAIVAGGSGGIGSAICAALAASGTNVAFTWRTRKTSADSVVTAVEAHGRECAGRCRSITPMPEAMKAFVDEAAGQVWPRFTPSSTLLGHISP